MKKFLQNLILFSALFIFCSLLTNPVQAATMKTLSANKGYSVPDITGDNKADKLVITSGTLASSGKYCINVKVNNKSSLILYPKYSKKPTIKYFILDNKTSCLFLSGQYGNNSQEYARLYIYKNKKYTRALNLRSIVSTNYFCKFKCTPQYVSKNSIAFRCSGNTYSVGSVDWLESFNFSSGKISRQIKAQPILPSSNGKAITRTAKRSFYLKKSALSTQNSSIVSKNEKVTIYSAYVSKQKLYFRIKKANGTLGWMPAMTRASWQSKNSPKSGYYFKNLSLV